MSSKEGSLKITLERPSIASSSSSYSSSTTTSTPSLTPSSTAPTTPAVEKEEPLAPTPLAIAANPPAAAAAHVATARAPTTTGATHRHPLSPLERDYDPGPDDLPIEELLARPRLPRSPYESLRQHAVNGRTLEPLEGAAAGAEAARRRAEDLEQAKARLRAVSVEIGRMTFPKK